MDYSLLLGMHHTKEVKLKKAKAAEIERNKLGATCLLN